MKSKISIFLLILFITFASLSRVSAVSLWISGTITSDGVSKQYNGEYVQFDFRVENASALGLPLPSVLPFSLICVVPESLGNITDFVKDKQYNFTGDVVTAAPSDNSVPVGFFIVETINTVQSSGSPGWITTLTTLITTILSVSKLSITLIVQIIGAACGIEVPEWIIALALVIATTVMLVKWGKTLPWLLVLIAVLCCLAWLANLFLGFHV